jgi:hypothetical protein
MRNFFIALALMLTATVTARATITLQDTFHLGDLDIGATNGASTETSDDGITFQAMTMVGSPTYVTDVPPDYPFITTYAMDFSDNAYGYEEVVTNATDNFGVSAWVKPRDLNDTECIAFNGDVDNNGWGLMQVGNTFQGSFGGVTFIGSAPVVTNQWTHLALVCASGVATLYVNGVASGSMTNNPLPASGDWAIAGSPPSFDGGFFDGRIDEVTVFTFAPGAFTTNDLQYAPPSARFLSFTNVAGSAVITWPTNQAYMQLQSISDLTLSPTNWSNVPYTANASGQFIATITPSTTASFYRLVKQPNLQGPFIPSINLTRSNSNYTNPVPVDLGGSVNTQLANQAQAFNFAATIINPLTGVADGIAEYYWFLQYSDVNPYTDAGIQGYQAQTLHIDKNALLATSSGNTCVMTLVWSPWLSTQMYGYGDVMFPIQVTSTGLTLSMYSTCQNPACDGGIGSPGCGCTIPAALPAD